MLADNQEHCLHIHYCAPPSFYFKAASASALICKVTISDRCTLSQNQCASSKLQTAFPDALPITLRVADDKSAAPVPDPLKYRSLHAFISACNMHVIHTF